jgi:hypothetical protein
MNRSMLLGSTLTTAAVLSGCLVGPHYQRPAVTAPPIYRDAAAGYRRLQELFLIMRLLRWAI